MMKTSTTVLRTLNAHGPLSTRQLSELTDLSTREVSGAIGGSKSTGRIIAIDDQDEGKAVWKITSVGIAYLEGLDEEDTISPDELAANLGTPGVYDVQVENGQEVTEFVAHVQGMQKYRFPITVEAIIVRVRVAK